MKARAHLAALAILVYQPNVVRLHPATHEVHAVFGCYRTGQLYAAFIEFRFSRIRANLCEGRTFVMITSSSRGRLSFLMTFPSMTSDSPFEYTYTAIQHQHT